MAALGWGLVCLGSLNVSVTDLPWTHAKASTQLGLARLGMHVSR